MTNKSKGDYAYTLLDLQTKPTQEVVDKLRKLDGVLRVRIVKIKGESAAKSAYVYFAAAPPF